MITQREYGEMDTFCKLLGLAGIAVAILSLPIGMVPLLDEGLDGYYWGRMRSLFELTGMFMALLACLIKLMAIVYLDK